MNDILKDEVVQRSKVALALEICAVTAIAVGIIWLVDGGADLLNRQSEFYRSLLAGVAWIFLGMLFFAAAKIIQLLMEISQKLGQRPKESTVIALGREIQVLSDETRERVRLAKEAETRARVEQAEREMRESGTW